MTSLAQLWSKLPLGVRKEIVSFLITFTTTLMGYLVVQQEILVDGSWPAIAALLTAAVRSGVKQAVLVLFK